MDRFAYFVWILLPLALGLLTAWAQMKKSFKMSGQEDPRDYLKQFIFVLVGFLAAVGLDKVSSDWLYENIPLEEVDIDIARWLIYPALLVAMSYLIGFRDRKKAAKGKEKKKRPNYSPGRGA